MPNTPFLKQVALYFRNTQPRQLVKMLFVFPNKRSTTFFKHYLREALPPGSAYVEPECMDMSKFVSRYSPLAEASRHEMLFTLYDAYTRIATEHGDESHIIPFERFIFWGDMLIGDFNDVDRYLVDPETIFTNIQRLKEIESDYLSEDQKEVIRRYWSAEESSLQNTPGRFWKHIGDGDGSGPRHRFARLWELLGPLYQAYHSLLSHAGLTTSGLAYRQAADEAGSSRIDSTVEHFVFVGFNVLTAAEMKIFRRLKATGRSSFFWDFNSPALADPTNKAGRFIRRNMEDFPMPDDFNEPEITTFPDIEIIGIPSNVGQAKMAGRIITKWRSRRLISPAPDKLDTAVVLPDESLFLPLTNSIPPSVSHMNVTMGFPMRLSPVSALIGTYNILQKNARRCKGQVVSYYFDDVRALLTTPLVHDLAPDEVNLVNREITRSRLYQLPPEKLKQMAPTLFPLLTPLDRDASVSQTIDILLLISGTIKQLLSPDDKVQTRFVESFEESVKSIGAAAAMHHVDMKADTFLSMVTRAVRGDTIAFKGEPLRGLQIMGMLETRALDFTNIIITSMNEQIFPRKMHTRSFIPDMLRRAYGMATSDFQESIFAYYFYRLIARADNVALIYDSRMVGGTRNNEMSRYLTQLLYAYPQAKVRHTAAGFKPSSFSLKPTTIAKTPEIMDKLRLYATPGSGANLSASSINKYINCPLEFYLEYVEMFKPGSELVDYVDASTYGSIVHHVMEHIYTPGGDSDCPAVVTREMIDRLLHEKSPSCLDNLITQAINKYFYKNKDADHPQPLAGETLVLHKVIRTNLITLLELDRLVTPFTMLGVEEEIKGSFKVNDHLAINFIQKIDRVDSISDPDDPSKELVRIIDYKTGSDSLKASGVESFFTPSADRPKAFMQLFFYCHAWCRKHHHSEAVKPMIYKLRDIAAYKLFDLTIGKEKVTDYRPYIDSYLELFRNTISEIFDPDVPFRPAKDDHACLFCQFSSLCFREERTEQDS